MAVTITIDGSNHELPEAAVIPLAHELRASAEGDPEAARALAMAIERRLTDPTRGPLVITEPADLDALHRALNATVNELGPTMELFNAVDMARRSAF